MVGCEPALTRVQSAAGPLTLPVTMNEMLLRGCMLKNSRYILGLVVYTGPESRIQMNAAKTPNKVGASPCSLEACPSVTWVPQCSCGPCAAAYAAYGYGSSL